MGNGIMQTNSNMEEDTALCPIEEIAESIKLRFDDFSRQGLTDEEIRESLISKYADTMDLLTPTQLSEISKEVFSRNKRYFHHVPYSPKKDVSSSDEMLNRLGSSLHSEQSIGNPKTQFKTTGKDNNSKNTSSMLERCSNETNTSRNIAEQKTLVHNVIPIEESRDPHGLIIASHDIRPCPNSVHSSMNNIDISPNTINDNERLLISPHESESQILHENLYTSDQEHFEQILELPSFSLSRPVSPENHPIHHTHSSLESNVQDQSRSSHTPSPVIQLQYSAPLRTISNRAQMLLNRQSTKEESIPLKKLPSNDSIDDNDNEITKQYQSSIKRTTSLEINCERSVGGRILLARGLSNGMQRSLSYDDEDASIPKKRTSRIFHQSSEEFNLINDNNSNSITTAANMFTTATTTTTTTTTTASNNSSITQEEIERTKLTCLICNMAFVTQSKKITHERFSSLHVKNVQLQQLQHSQQSQSITPGGVVQILTNNTQEHSSATTTNTTTHTTTNSSTTAQVPINKNVSTINTNHNHNHNHSSNNDHPGVQIHLEQKIFWRTRDHIDVHIFLHSNNNDNNDNNNNNNTHKSSTSTSNRSTSSGNSNNNNTSNTNNNKKTFEIIPFDVSTEIELNRIYLDMNTFMQSVGQDHIQELIVLEKKNSKKEGVVHIWSKQDEDNEKLIMNESKIKLHVLCVLIMARIQLQLQLQVIVAATSSEVMEKVMVYIAAASDNNGHGNNNGNGHSNETSSDPVLVGSRSSHLLIPAIVPRCKKTTLNEISKQMENLDSINKEIIQAEHQADESADR